MQECRRQSIIKLCRLTHETPKGDQNMDKKYFLMGNAHLDPVWQWRVPEGLALVKSTFKAALDRMEEFPDYVFTSACAGYYQWIKLSETEMFEEIKKKENEEN